MDPRSWAHTDRIAVVVEPGEVTLTYRDLDERANRLAHVFRANGIRRGDVVAILMENVEHFHVVAWAARRSGLYFVAVNTNLTGPEAAFIVRDCQSVAVVATSSMCEVARYLTEEVVPKVRLRLMAGGVEPGWASYEGAMMNAAAEPITDESPGDLLQYSSGTTGRPKGIKRELEEQGTPDPTMPFLQAIGFNEGGVYLSPAPLYHTAPIYWTMAVHRLGGTTVVMNKFDPEDALALIEKYRVTHAQFVPAMFVKMLKLDEPTRSKYDVSSLVAVVHAAAPCPVPIKRAMIAWWGRIVSEYYSSSEGAGATFITAPDWLEHPGSVGRAMMGSPVVIGPEGEELPTGEVGDIYFAESRKFGYLGDPDKTAAAHDAEGRSTVGDVGFLDEEGYLYLTDRRNFVIIANGVNIYPQESENLLIAHPKVADAAVFGIPDVDRGEQVHAVVQPLHPAEAGDTLAEELLSYCRENLAAYKCPRAIDFDMQLPRLDSGKLYKKKLRDKYWA
ncbi:acyl-CoA synthetase [Rhodococcoides yunnanense]|uniref:Acyl-CoA synthetase n=1 Tax=Rhodococcoides yunnanense TaxID=278209 RepID=A0ABU4BKB0_9NOCA|nr:acyl-CoA synthetase [Rhodococcus yunnanensis]MDV6264649.1 acyl-CoA synthetase [Rhodococcus yunnanensis]